MKIDESCIARRRFLGSMLGGGGAAALGAGMALPLVSFVANQREPVPPFLEISKADYDLAPGTSKMLMYGRIPVLLIRPPGGALKAFVAICTHFDCTVGYRRDINRIHCACHDGYYFVDGRVDCGPPPRPLDELHTAFRGDSLVIALEKEGLEKAL